MLMLDPKANYQHQHISSIIQILLNDFIFINYSYIY